MPLLHWLKENDTIVTTDSPSGFQSNILDTGKYIVLNSSNDGTVRYHKPEVNSSDSGTYVAMATYGNYYQIISTVAITIGKLSSTQLLRNACTYLQNKHLQEENAKIFLHGQNLQKFTTFFKRRQNLT